jgi:hypothetical protein
MIMILSGARIRNVLREEDPWRRRGTSPTVAEARETGFIDASMKR